MKNSIDEQIEKLEKDLLSSDNELSQNNTPSNNDNTSSTDTPKSDNSLFIGIGLLVPFLVAGVLYYLKPTLIMEHQKKKKQLNFQRFVMIIAGTTLFSWIVLYSFSTKS